MATYPNQLYWTAPDIQPARQQPYGLLAQALAGGGGGGRGSLLGGGGGSGAPQQGQSQGLLGELGGIPGLMQLKGLLGGSAQNAQAPNPFTQGLFGGGANATWDPQAQSVDQIRSALNAPTDSSSWLGNLFGGGNSFGGGNAPWGQWGSFTQMFPSLLSESGGAAP